MPTRSSGKVAGLGPPRTGVWDLGAPQGEVEKVNTDPYRPSPWGLPPTPQHTGVGVVIRTNVDTRHPYKKSNAVRNDMCHPYQGTPRHAYRMLNDIATWTL